MRTFIRSITRRISNAIQGFFRRLGYAATNRMSLGAWLFTVFSLVGLLISLGGYYWLHIVSKQYSIPTTETPIVDPIILEPISDIRRDVDVVLAIDFSGSMDGDHGSDPDELRLQAAEIMASSLAADIYPRQTRMGYVEFGSKAIDAQELILIDSNDARLQLINAIYQPSPGRKSDPEFGDYTNIGATLEMVDLMLHGSSDTSNNNSSSEPMPEKNTPALIILTDGRPTAGYTTEERITDLIEDLVQKKTLIFIIVLRNPDNEANNDQDIEGEFEDWRELWGVLANTYPLNVEYDEAQDDTQLEYIYNKIRSRLVQEGTKLEGRILYDPSDPNSQIIMPPNLLQAHLILSKPVGTQSIELIDPYGNNFANQVQTNASENDILNGNFFIKFKIAYPKAGSWKLITDAKKPLYYLLNTESIYSVRLAWPIGSPYLYKSQRSQVPFVIADEQGNIVDKTFNLNASILRSEQDETGAYVEKAYPLSAIYSKKVSGKTQYFIDVTPGDFLEESIVGIQVDGSADDGSLVNSIILKLPVVDAPSGINDQTNTQVSQPCLVSKKVFWPPSLVCENKVDLSVQIAGDELLKSETVNGKLYSPFSTDPVDMELQDSNTLYKVVGPIQAVGSYQLIIDIGGALKQQENDFQWNQRIIKTIKIETPDWVELMKLRCSYAVVLFLICTLWKIIIVPILLLVFSLFRLAPEGSYSTNLSSWFPIFMKAMQKRKLFTLNVGYRANNDIHNISDNNSPNIRNKLLNLIYRYLRNAPRAHIFWIPFIGLYGEDDHGTWSIKADADTSAMISAGQTRIYIKG